MLPNLAFFLFVFFLKKKIQQKKNWGLSQAHEKHTETSGHEALCRLHGKKMNRLDPWFSLDVKLLEHVTGPEGSAHLMAKFLEKCVASAERHFSIEEALEASAVLRKSALFRWAAADTQSKLQAGHDMLMCVSTMQPLPLGKNDDEFVAKIFAGMIWFVSFEQQHDAAAARGAAEPPPATAPLRGMPALKALWKRVKDDKNAKLDELKRISVFRHLLEIEDQAKLDSMISASFKVASRSRKLAVDSGMAPPAKKAKTGGKKVNNAEILADVADALLYGDS